MLKICRSTFKRFDGRAPIAALCVLCAVGLMTLACLNPTLTNTISGGANVPITPGTTDFILIQVINNSSFFLDAIVNVDVPGGGLTANLDTIFANIRPSGGNAGVVLPCPVDRVGLGDLNNLSSVGFSVGLTTADQVGIAWGQAPLVSGFNYECGDTIIFASINDANANGGVRIDAGVVDGAAQPVPVVDTFGTLEAVLTANGF